MKKFLIIGALAVTILISFGLYQYFKKPANTYTAKADFQTTAIDLTEEFNTDEQAANLKYQEKIIEVTGVISDLQQDGGNITVFLDTGDPINGITCSFYGEETSKLDLLHTGDNITIRGKFIGRLTDIILNNCIIVKP